MNKQHLAHLEDIVFEGPESAFQIYNILTTMISGHVQDLQTRIKIDGSPSIVFGPDPADGVFCLATKGAFAKTPKLAKSHEDIDRLYTTTVNPILHRLFDTLPALQPTQMLQGDVLFTETPTVHRVQDVLCTTFQPNTLTYAVPWQSAVGIAIRTATVGIAIHTEFMGDGPDFATYTQIPVSCQTMKRLHFSHRVWVYDNQYQGQIRLPVYTKWQMKRRLRSALKGLIQMDPAVYPVLNAEPLRGLLSKYINQAVRQNTPLAIQDAAECFAAFLRREGEAAAMARKTVAAQESQRQCHREMAEQVLQYRQSMTDLFRYHKVFDIIKQGVITALDRDTSLPAYLYGVRTSPEGYVVQDVSGMLVKLVNRREFSLANFKKWEQS